MQEAGEKVWQSGGGPKEHGIDTDFLHIPKYYRPIAQHPSLREPGDPEYRCQLALLKQIDPLTKDIVGAAVVVIMKLWASVWSKRLHTEKKKCPKTGTEVVRKVRKPARHPCGFPILTDHCAKLRCVTPQCCGTSGDTLTYTALTHQKGFQGPCFFLPCSLADRG